MANVKILGQMLTGEYLVLVTEPELNLLDLYRLKNKRLSTADFESWFENRFPKQNWDRFTIRVVLACCRMVSNSRMTAEQITKAINTEDAEKLLLINGIGLQSANHLIDLFGKKNDRSYP